MNQLFDYAFGLYLRKIKAAHSELVKEFSSRQFEFPQNAIKWLEERIEEPTELYKHFVFQLFQWLFECREHTNYTFEMTPSSKIYLANTLSLLTGHNVEVIRGFFDEVEKDRVLQDYIDKVLESVPEFATLNSRVSLGRRLGWYALVRATKPRLVVETGIDKGLSSCLLSIALLKNRSEGLGGDYVGIDINPDAGILFKGVFKGAGKIVTDDSVNALKTINTPIDMLILDSDHTEGYETRELETAEPNLSESSILISDTAKHLTSLYDYSVKTERIFHYAPEYITSWYPGDGNGYATRRREGPIRFQ